MNTDRKLLLVKPDYRYYPLSLSYVASTLERGGYEYDYIDLHFDNPDLEGILRKGEYSAVASGGLVRDFLRLEGFFKQVKKIVPTMPLIIGGLVARDVGYKTLFEHIPVDYAVVGEAEITLPKLLDHIYSGAPDLDDIRGVIYRLMDGGVKRNRVQERVELTKLRPRPSFTFFDHDKWPHDDPALPIPVTTGRGCYASCTFCQPSFRTFQPRVFEDIFLDVERQVTRWNVPHIQFLNEVLFADEEMIIDFCKEYKKNFKTPFLCVLRLTVNPNVLEALKDAGCIDINVGIESGSENVLKNMKKGTTLKDIRRFVQGARKSRITLNSGLLFNNRGETEQDVEISLAFDKELDNVRTEFIYCIPYNGTPLYNQLKKAGRADDEYQFILNMETIYSHQFQTDMLFINKPDGKPVLPNVTDIPDEKFVRVMHQAFRRYFENYELKNARLVSSESHIRVIGECPVCQTENEFRFNFKRPIQMGFMCKNTKVCLNDRHFHVNICAVTAYQPHRAEVIEKLRDKKRIAIVSYDSHILKSVLSHDMFDFAFDDIVIMASDNPALKGACLFSDKYGNKSANTLFVDIERIASYDPDVILIADGPTWMKATLKKLLALGFSKENIATLYPENILRLFENQEGAQLVESLDNVKKVVIFGCGAGGLAMLELSKHFEWEVVCFVDNNNALWGSAIEGIPIVSPQTLSSDNYDLVIVASKEGKTDIIAQLKALDMQLNRDFIYMLE